jgi:hypothetical protein
MANLATISRSEFLRLLGISGVAFALGETTASGSPTDVRCQLTPNVLLVGRRNVFRAHVSGLGDASSGASCMGLQSAGGLAVRGEATFDFDGVAQPTLEAAAGITRVAVDGPDFRGHAPVMLVRPEACLIYRTSVRGRKACPRCRDHAATVVYVSQQAAEEARCHPRCRCPVVSEKVHWEFFARAFWPTGPGAGVLHDRRWGWPAQAPVGLALQTVSGPRG